MSAVNNNGGHLGFNQSCSRQMGLIRFQMDFLAFSVFVVRIRLDPGLLDEIIIVIDVFLVIESVIGRYMISHGIFMLVVSLLFLCSVILLSSLILTHFFFKYVY